ncbi:MAG: hypothetical protein P8Q36_08200 [Alphaproteobacteria bacterium]|jgi:uncharacterized membrane protein|nr:hypothetical protein [Rhodospirillaceae bacterium]MBT6202712.1 hypothetical protein [Rhodospirillaceae bacterium]MBT6509786.1 hypothetical protein [Rhodospirillaceae bacterium]MBT7647326.1 hypothetical protein [Rhodospirillaceae bacterium]MDG2480836.1 hypothetical protein [Alphaproteobacteria bacterium]
MTEPTQDDSKAWFRKKRHGVGYSPNSWQGWAVTLLVVVVIVVLAITLAG